MKCAYWWERKLKSGVTLYLCCYRDGLGKVVLMQTTHTLFGPGKWIMQFKTPNGLKGDPVALDKHAQLKHFSPEVLQIYICIFNN